MFKSKMESLLEKLYSPKTNLSLLLLEAKQIANDYDDRALSDYIDKEVNGYKTGDDLPDYRVVKGQIVADIKDVYGEIIQTQYPLDFSTASQEVGFDLATLKLFDGLSFIENSLGGLKGNYGLKQMSTYAIKMLDEVFHHNNAHLHLAVAYHRIPTPLLAYIPVVVRENIIQHIHRIQNMLKKENVVNDVNTSMSLSKAEHIKVFVTYAWGSDDENSKIVSFVEFLRNNGFDAFMDKKISQEGTAVNFNQLMIEGIKNSDKIIIVLSKKYKEKADKFEGGVWTELNIIIEDMKQKRNKYIFVHFGYDDRLQITPTAVSAIDLLDLKKDQDEHNFNSLFAKIKEENIIDFSDVNSIEVHVKKTPIKPFKL